LVTTLYLARLRGAWQYIFVFVIVFVVWLPTVTNGLLWDDYESVQLTPQRWHWRDIRDYFLPTASDPSNLRPLPPDTSYLRPLPRLTFYIDDGLWGGSRYWGWHLTNVTLHAFNAVLVAAIAARLGPLASVAAGLAFGLHPIHTESVGWITARFDLLMTLFLLVSTWLLIRGHLSLSAIAFVASLLSKEMAVTFPLLVTGWLIFQRRSPWGSGFHWLGLLGYGIYRWFALGGLGGQWHLWHWDIMGWVVRPWWALAYPLPLNLSGWPPPGAFPAWGWWGATLVCAAIALCLLWQVRRLWPLALALLVTLLPLLPLFQLGPSFQFGRHLYWPAAVWGLLLGIAFRPAPRWFMAPLGLYAVTIIGLGVPPRVQLYQAGATSASIIEGVVEAVPTVPSGARLWVAGVPTHVNGWGVFGPYLGLALNTTYGYSYKWQEPPVQVMDVSWETGVRGQPPPAQPDYMILLWGGTDITLVRPSAHEAFFSKNHATRTSSIHDGALSKRHDATISRNGTISGGRHGATRSVGHESFFSKNHDSSTSWTHDGTWSAWHEPAVSLGFHITTRSLNHDTFFSKNHDPPSSSVHDGVLSKRHDPGFSRSGSVAGGRHGAARSVGHDALLSMNHTPETSWIHDGVWSAWHEPAISFSIHVTTRSLSHHAFFSENHVPTTSWLHDGALSQGHQPMFSKGSQQRYLPLNHDPQTSWDHDGVLSRWHQPALSTQGHHQSLSLNHDPFLSGNHDPATSWVHDGTMSQWHAAPVSAGQHSVMASLHHDAFFSENHNPRTSQIHDGSLSRHHTSPQSLQRDPAEVLKHAGFFSSAHDPATTWSHDNFLSQWHDSTISLAGHDPTESFNHLPDLSQKHDPKSSWSHRGSSPTGTTQTGHPSSQGYGIITGEHF